jgi:hypothetical protein
MPSITFTSFSASSALQHKVLVSKKYDVPLEKAIISIDRSERVRVPGHQATRPPHIVGPISNVHSKLSFENVFPQILSVDHECHQPYPEAQRLLGHFSSQEAWRLSIK